MKTQIEIPDEMIIAQLKQSMISETRKIATPEALSGCVDKLVKEYMSNGSLLDQIACRAIKVIDINNLIELLDVKVLEDRIVDRAAVMLADKLIKKNEIDD